jgi:hypothetical protein
MSDVTAHEKEFLVDLDREIEWHWKWEKQWRDAMFRAHWAGWVIRVLLLVITSVQLSVFDKSVPPLWLLFTMAFLALVNVALPQLASTFRFQQRQQVYDWHARAYSVIRTELVSGQLDLPTAVRRFSEIRAQPTESIIRGTP